ncbi:hypothetical protein [Ruminococcus albus]|uniref:Uncharacterized protein n=1 Tax=Ruminococcus albus (strain ATCC 27210 / DSM 20455 / JCM 14654 / NCDO 2250 / 7) TaxID=697329 RepID=E6UHW5_RUMA7|nr:hypothetical protein [Ruminococcus albus]ADU23252.1 hypothetical protein Rumal_2783 [Ruminococcus albus 7 = DSM 20455]
MKITILPTTGIEFDGKRICLGSSAEEIKAVLGQPEDEYTEDDITRLFYFESELRFDIDKDGVLEFIEFLGFEGELRPVIYGTNVFETDADEVLDILTEKNGGDIIDEEDGYSYAFPDIGIGITRDATPESIDEMIAEYEEDGEEIDDEVLEFEKRRASHWATIGLGNSEYYDFLSE